jgi:ABC-type nitrate/sulfonate/bicarbonate transport system substrate-binding protein
MLTILQLGGHPQVAAAMAAGKLEVGALGGLAALTAERAGARLLTSAVELKILSPSGTFGTTRGYIQRKRTVVERLMRSFVEALHYLKTNRAGSIALLQKYFGGLNAEEAAYLYDEQVDLLERLPGPNDKALQAVLDRENDAKLKTMSPADFTDASFPRYRRWLDRAAVSEVEKETLLHVHCHSGQAGDSWRDPESRRTDDSRLRGMTRRTSRNRMMAIQ